MGKYKKELRKKNKIKKAIVKEVKELDSFFIETKKKYMEIDPVEAERLIYPQFLQRTDVDQRLIYE